MPRALDTQTTFRVVLPYDRDKPEAEQPAFLVRQPSCREQIKLGRVWQDIQELEDPGDQIDELLDRIWPLLRGWRNIDQPFERERLDDVLNMWDAIELANAILSDLQVKDDELGNSASPPCSGAGGSAGSAEEHASTPRPRSSRPRSGAPDARMPETTASSAVDPVICNSTSAPAAGWPRGFTT